MENKNIEEEKQIPLKNYIYVIVMFILVILAVLGLSTWYRNYKKYEFSTPVISGKVQEISKNEFKEYVNSHDNFYLYIGTADNKACRDLEMNLVDLLNKYNVKNDTVYLNASNASKDEIIELLKEYGYNGKKITYPAFLVVKDNYVIAYQMKDANSLTIRDIEKLIQASGVVK